MKSVKKKTQSTIIIFIFIFAYTFKKENLYIHNAFKKFASKSISYKEDLSSFKVLNDSALTGSALFVTFCQNFNEWQMSILIYFFATSVRELVYLLFLTKYSTVESFYSKFLMFVSTMRVYRFVRMYNYIFVTNESRKKPQFY